jgi:hypothetical protein
MRRIPARFVQRLLSEDHKARSVSVCRELRQQARDDPNFISNISDIQGIVHKEFLPPGHIVNDKYYCEVLKRLREGIRRKPSENWKKNNWFLHHEKAPAHTSLVVRQFLTSKNITVIPHPPPTPIRLTSPPATFSYSPR